jgi:hypothetical protein
MPHPPGTPPAATSTPTDAVAVRDTQRHATCVHVPRPTLLSLCCILYRHRSIHISRRARLPEALRCGIIWSIALTRLSQASCRRCETDRVRPPKLCPQNPSVLGILIGHSCATAALSLQDASPASPCMYAGEISSIVARLSCELHSRTRVRSGPVVPRPRYQSQGCNTLVATVPRFWVRDWFTRIPVVGPEWTSSMWSVVSNPAARSRTSSRLRISLP